MNGFSLFTKPQGIDYSMSLMTPAGVVFLLLFLSISIYLGILIHRGKCRRSEIFPILFCSVSLLGTLLLARSFFIGDSGVLAQGTHTMKKVAETQIHTVMKDNLNGSRRMRERWTYKKSYTQDSWEHDCENYVRGFSGIVSLVWVNPEGVVTWACPAAAKAKFLHFDLRKQPERYARFLKLKETRKEIFSPTLKTPLGNYGFSFSQPLYIGDKFDGALSMVFDTSLLVSTAVDSTDYAVRILENSNLIYDSDPGLQFKEGEFSYSWLAPLNFNFDSIHWTVSLFPKPATVARERMEWPELALWIGNIFSFLLALAMRSYLKAFELSDVLSRALEREKAILEGSAFGVIATDANGRIRTLNPAASKILGYTEEEMVGKYAPELWGNPGELAERMEEISKNLGTSLALGFEALKSETRSNRVDRSECTFVTKCGKTLRVALSIHALHNVQGKVNGFVGIFEDVTESRTLAEKVQFQQAKIIESSKLAALGEMAGGVAHEINNPLSVISGKAQLLRLLIESDHPDKEKMNLQVNAILSTVKRITRIISGMQSFARDATDDPFIRTSISDLIRDTTAFCAERFRSHSVELRVIIEDDGLLEGYCRPSQISQVILNLLNNAFDAVTESEVQHPWVSLLARSKGDGVEICVSDCGKGVPAELRDKIMNPFFTTKPVGKGTGLGLSIAHGIMTEHGGRLYLDPDSPQTKFVIWLPKAHRSAGLVQEESMVASRS